MSKRGAYAFPFRTNPSRARCSRRRARVPRARGARHDRREKLASDARMPRRPAERAAPARRRDAETRARRHGHTSRRPGVVHGVRGASASSRARRRRASLASLASPASGFSRTRRHAESRGDRANGGARRRPARRRERSDVPPHRARPSPSSSARPAPASRRVAPATPRAPSPGFRVSPRATHPRRRNHPPPAPNASLTLRFSFSLSASVSQGEDPIPAPSTRCPSRAPSAP